MDEKLNKIREIIFDFKNRSNSDLILAMDFLQEDFESTKRGILELTKRLDEVELHYNKILDEYKVRTNGKS
jgi:hypothetical protein